MGTVERSLKWVFLFGKRDWTRFQLKHRQEIYSHEAACKSVDGKLLRSTEDKRFLI